MTEPIKRLLRKAYFSRSLNRRAVALYRMLNPPPYLRPVPPIPRPASERPSLPIADLPSFKGDRILVNKFVYEMPWLPGAGGPAADAGRPANVGVRAGPSVFPEEQGGQEPSNGRWL